MARSYPDTPAGRSRRLRDADNGHMTRNGHRMKWRRWRKGSLRGGGNWLGVPGWEGRRARCGDTVQVAATGGGCYRAVTRADGTPCSFRKCRKDRHS